MPGASFTYGAHITQLRAATNTEQPRSLPDQNGGSRGRRLAELSRSVRPVTMVVNDVSVLMTMHGGVMMMHRHCSSASNPCVRLAVAM